MFWFQAFWLIGIQIQALNDQIFFDKYDFIKDT
jgi:hypothetical protein